MTTRSGLQRNQAGRAAALFALTVSLGLAMLISIYSDKEGLSFRPSNKEQAQNHTGKKIGARPLIFEPNYGQMGSEAKFLARGGNFLLALTLDRVSITLLREKAVPSRNLKPQLGKHRKEPREMESETVQLQLLNTLTSTSIRGVSPLPGHSNYYKGQDPKQWVTDVPHFAKVRYSDVYPGVDMVYYGNTRKQLEHDFIVSPGTNPDFISFQVTGADVVRVDGNGDLVIDAGSEQLHLLKPVAYQETGSERQPVEAEFQLSSNSRVSFQIGNYDSSRTLIIDPSLVFLTYWGGSDTDGAGDDKRNKFLFLGNNSAIGTLKKV